MLVYSLVFIFSYIALFNCEEHFKRKPLPDYIKPCSANSPDLSECAKKHATLAIPSLLKGDPKFKLQSLVPFHLDKVELKPSDRLSLILTDAKLYGLDTLKLIDTSFDLKRRHIQLRMTTKYLRLDSNYNISGQILIVPISGNGPATFRFDDNFADYSLDYDLLKKPDGFTYIGNIRSLVYFNITKAHYQLDNLYNGNKELGDSTNKLLNENSQEVLNDFRAAVSEILQLIITRIANAYLTVAPYDEIFVP